MIASGHTHTRKGFVEAAFAEVGLDLRSHAKLSESLRRPSEILYSAGNTEAAERIIKWRAGSTMLDIVRAMVVDEMSRAPGRRSESEPTVSPAENERA